MSVMNDIAMQRIRPIGRCGRAITLSNVAAVPPAFAFIFVSVPTKPNDHDSDEEVPEEASVLSDSGESGDGESDEERIELALDDDGRVEGTSDCGLNFDFRAFRAQVNVDSKHPLDKANRSLLEVLRSDCDAVFGSEDSFWLGANVTPRCSLERMAAAVFAFHTKHVSSFDPDNSGAEWWVTSFRRWFVLGEITITHCSLHLDPCPSHGALGCLVARLGLVQGTSTLHIELPGNPGCSQRCRVLRLTGV
eukprot:822639-Prorocentrum_minimum.AAC.1